MKRDYHVVCQVQGAMSYVPGARCVERWTNGVCFKRTIKMQHSGIDLRFEGHSSKKLQSEINVRKIISNSQNQRLVDRSSGQVGA